MTLRGFQFEKYNWRMLPVVDAGDRLLGIIGYRDVIP